MRKRKTNIKGVKKKKRRRKSKRTRRNRTRNNRKVKNSTGHKHAQEKISKDFEFSRKKLMVIPLDSCHLKF